LNDRLRARIERRVQPMALPVRRQLAATTMNDKRRLQTAFCGSIHAFERQAAVINRWILTRFPWQKLRENGHPGPNRPQGKTHRQAP
jgi:hypothetical protein